MPLRAQESAVTWAANGVDLREPLKPAGPALSHAMTFPSLSVRLTIVLLKDVLMCAWPMAMFFFTRRRARPLVSAGRRHPDLRLFPRPTVFGPLRVRALVFVRWPFTGSRGGGGCRGSADLLQALDRLGALAAQLALDLEVRVDVRPELGDLLVREVADLSSYDSPGSTQIFCAVDWPIP